MKYEIQYRVKNLLNTIQEAVEYIGKLINELKYEGAEYLIEDIIDAVQSIENALIENYIDTGKETQKLLKELERLKVVLENDVIGEEVEDSLVEVKSEIQKWERLIKAELGIYNIN